ncbi:MAG: hypothetical protein WKG03_00020 [Telluria sp.]
MAQVRAELGLSGPISFGQAEVRTLAGAPSGAISLANLHNKSAYTPMTVVGHDVYVDEAAPGTAYTGNWYPAVTRTAGGVGPFTYAWTFISGASAFTLVTANAAQAQIRRGVTKFGTHAVATMSCRVTDTFNGQFVDRTVEVYINIYDGTAV